MKRSVLVVDDERVFRVMAEEALAHEGFEVKTAATLARARAELAQFTPDVIVLDRRLPDGDGLQLIETARSEGSSAPMVIVVTAYGDVENAVQALRAGASDYLTKPIQLPDLLVKLNKALEARGLRDQLALVKSSALRPQIVEGDGKAQREVRKRLDSVAQSPLTPVLLIGPSGAGKQCAAELLHAMTYPCISAAPFVEVNCAAIPRDLFESELFGHERGAFTDARSSRRGLTELADGGTLFLDEVTELAEQSQAKLLKFLDTMRFRRVGGQREMEVRLRVVAATNQEPARLVDEGKLRADLYHRLSVFTVELPALRERREDIQKFVEGFVRYYADRVKKRVNKVSPAALAMLSAYDYPGNIRELRNIIERAVILARGNELTENDIVLPNRPSLMPPPQIAPHSFFSVALEAENPPALEQVEKAYVAHVLSHFGGKRMQAAQSLGISYPTFLKRLRELGLD
jgi:two-component system response regulator AtoC